MYLRHGLEELYDLASDPDETRDLAGDPRHRTELGVLRRACSAAFPPEEIQAALTPTAKVSSADLQGLRSLGYIGGYTPAGFSLQRADIRQVCDEEARFNRASEASKRDHNPKLMAEAYKAILAKYPQAALCWQQFGTFLLERHDMEEAARAFEQAVRFNPKDLVSLINLSGLELAKGRVERSRVLLESALAVYPDDPAAHKNLGIIYAEHLKDPSKAVQHYKRYLEIAPDADADRVRAYIARHAPP